MNEVISWLTWFLLMSKWVEFLYGSGLDDAYQFFIWEVWRYDEADKY